MEEAVSGVKGELAVKIYGDDLHTAGSQGRRDFGADAQHQRGRGPGNVPRHRPAQPQLHGESRRGRALRRQRGGRAGCDSDRGGRQRRQPGIGGRNALRPGGALSAALSRYARSHRFDPPAGAQRRARFPGATLRHPSRGRRVGNLPRGQLALRGDQIQRSRPRPGQHGGRSHRQGQEEREAARKGTRSGGRANTRARNGQTRVWHDPPHHHSADSHHPLYHVPLAEMGNADSGQHGHGPYRRIAGAVGDAHQFQRFLGRRFSGPVRRVGANRRDHAGIHQPASRARQHHREFGSGRGRAPFAAHHDDHAGGHVWACCRRHFRTPSARTRSGRLRSSSWAV